MVNIVDAVVSGDWKRFVNLLESCNDLDIRDDLNRTPLMYAVIDNELNVIKILIDKGAKVNLQDDNGYSALHFASQGYHLESANLLLESEVIVNVQDLQGNTPLFRAVFNSIGRGEMIKLLLNNGADRQLKNNHGVSPLQLAHTIGNYDVIQYFE